MMTMADGHDDDNDLINHNMEISIYYIIQSIMIQNSDSPLWWPR